MDPITFILGIAGGVLANAVSRLITGKPKSVTRAEIEGEVADRLIRSRTDQHQADLLTIKQKVMDEIEILAGRSSDLVISPEDIQLRKQFRRPLFHADEALKKELSDRLAALSEIVDSRRLELGLPLYPTSSVEVAPETKGESEGTTISWSKAPTDESPSRWRSQIADMEERIRNRRAGKEANHEE